MKSHLALAFAATLALIALAPAASLAQSQEEQQACMDDAFRLCGHAIPDRDRVAGCLSDNFNRISVACRTVMQRYSSASSSRPPANRRDRYNERF
ncbi:MAG: hypothetical protein K2Y27_00785 [Xanthobacteraceae bacterium]|nr:hypothetical protein [Xanthobacteraceae bacterium]